MSRSGRFGTECNPCRLPNVSGGPSGVRRAGGGRAETGPPPPGTWERAPKRLGALSARVIAAYTSAITVMNITALNYASPPVLLSGLPTPPAKTSLTGAFRR